MICPICAHENPAEARFCANCGSALAQGPASGADGLIGQLVGGRYLIKRVIGEGGMGVVYEAEQRMGSEVRRVAVKTLLPWLSKDPVIVSRFYRECGIVSQLEHPNTIKFYDFGETPNGALYISMEYVRGVPLTEIIAQGPVRLERVRNIVRQAAGALYEAHMMGIVHRDLKPDNIVLTSRAAEGDFIKLLDFGIAAQTDKPSSAETKLTQHGTVLGTPPYMSPEQLTGEPVDARSDIYSLGIIVYEMLSGHLPFDADTPWQWAQKHTLEPPPPLRDASNQPLVPPEVEHAVLHALAKRPADRPRTTLEFYAELSEAPRISGVPRASDAKVRTLDDPLSAVAPEGTSPMAMLNAEFGRTSPAGRPSFGNAVRERTELAPEYSPAFTTGAAVAAPIYAPRPPVRKSRSRWGVALGLFTGAASLTGVAFGVAYLLKPADSQPSAATAPAQVSAAAPAASASVVSTASPIPTSAAAPATATVDTQLPARPPAPTHARHRVPEPRLPPAASQTTPKPSETIPPAATNPPSTTNAPPPGNSLPPPIAQIPLPPPTSVEPPPNTARPPTAPPTTSAVTGDQACFQARDAAGRGNIETASALLVRCEQTGGSPPAQLAARQRIRGQVGEVVRKRAAVGDCAGARSAAAAANSVGVFEGSNELAQTRCG